MQLIYAVLIVISIAIKILVASRFVYCTVYSIEREPINLANRLKLGPQQIDELSVRASRSEEYQTLCLKNQSVERRQARAIESRFSPIVR